MTKYNTLNKKLSNSQLNKLKKKIKNDTEVTLNIKTLKVNISSKIGNSRDESNFPHKLLLTDTQSFCKWFIS